MPVSNAYNQDCMEGIKEFPDKFFELAIVDPPFGIGNFVQTSGNVRGKEVEWNNEIPNHLYFHLLRRVSKHQIIFGANYFNQFDDSGGAIVWVKNQPMPNFSKAVIASCSFHKKVELYEQTWTNFVNSKETDHPCEMPIALYQWLLKNYAKPGDKILDTHLGSGSSRIAAYKMGFDFWGYEIDKDYFDAQEKRFKQAIAEPLFEQPKIEQGKLI
jgi:site-specific DNA-methyltransferase (adenine-specific)